MSPPRGLGDSEALARSTPVPKFPFKATILAAMPDAGDAGIQTVGPLRLLSVDDSPTRSQRNRIVNTSSRCVTPAALRYPEAADYIGISTGTLRNWVSEGKGPISVVLGKRGRRFRISDLDAFLSSHLVSRDSVTDQLQPRRRGRPAKAEKHARHSSARGA